MLAAPDFPQKPFDLITTEKNKRIVKLLLSNGIDSGTINKILKGFFCDNLIFREIHKNAKNSEAIQMRRFYKEIVKHYDKSINIIEKLLINELIPIQTKKSIIETDINKLKDTRDFFSMINDPKIKIEPNPKSIQQMINFQSWALYKYIKNFNGKQKDQGITDQKIYALILELLKNLYRGTFLEVGINKITNNALKNNFIDNVYKLPTKKINELENYYNRIIV